MSARMNASKKDRVSAMEAMEAPTPPAPITRILIVNQTSSLLAL
jgi:hypothetical protein